MTKALQLQSHISRGGELTLSLAEIDLPDPGPDEVLVRVEASPINPSDLGLLLGPVDPQVARAETRDGRPAVVAPVSPKAVEALAARVDQAMPVGNEGAGTVLAAGAGAAHLQGRTVAMFGGGMWATHRLIRAAQCMALPEGAAPRDGASWYVNPMTALCMVETMRKDGHTALAHTAAASNLGQMLNRICLKDGIPLVNIVRSEAQAALLRGQGAQHVCDSSAPDFMERLTDALAATGATVAFDAVGGGPLAGQILLAMEQAIKRTATSYSHYGSDRHKQVYVYGRLNTGPTQFDRAAIGFAWGLSGFLLTPALKSLGAGAEDRLRARVAAELKTTFASHYTREIGLAAVLDLDVLRGTYRKATGEKYLILPQREG
jgi:NADPH2:quinone reductase